MDLTDKLASSCSLCTRWDGSIYHCRVCNRTLTGQSRKFCGKLHRTIWQKNHFYRKARSECKRLARRPCPCPRVRSHPTCVHCGVCEGILKQQGSRVEVNHIVPLRGSHRPMGCLNHLTNLELLCRECHLKVTRQQRVAYKK